VFFPYGRFDPLETAAVVAMVSHLDPDRACDMCSNRARRALGAAPVTLTVGAPAPVPPPTCWPDRRLLPYEAMTPLSRRQLMALALLTVAAAGCAQRDATTDATTDPATGDSTSSASAELAGVKFDVRRDPG
jgi:hypothetical protein